MPPDELANGATDGLTPSTPSSSSSPAPAPDTAATAPDQQSIGDKPTSASSPNAEGDSKETLLDAVLKAVPPSGKDSDKLEFPSGATPGSPTPQSDKADPADKDKPPPSEDPTPEELARYTSTTRARIQGLVAQRNEARALVEHLRSDSEVTRGLRSYLTQNNIGKEDFSVLLDLGSALQRGDFRLFLEGVGPYVQLAQEALGLTVPPDLRQQVEQGYMTTEAARRFAQERVARQLADSRADRATQQAQHTTTLHNTQALQNAVAGAVTQWENSVRQSDPDYGQKQELVRNMLWAVISEVGAPQTTDHAVRIAQEAYKRANETAAKFRPAPRPTQLVPSSIHRATGAVPEAKSLMDAAMIGLERARRSA